jgi:hypothetical protein
MQTECTKDTLAGGIVACMKCAYFYPVRLMRNARKLAFVDGG